MLRLIAYCTIRDYQQMVNVVVWLAAWIAVVSAAVLEGSVPGVQEVDVVVSHIIVRDLKTGHQRREYLTSSGNFSVGLQPGNDYELALQSSTLLAPFRYEVSVDPSTDEFTIRKVRGALVGHPLIIPSRRPELVVDRPSFSLWGMIKTPTVYMSLISLVMVASLPYIVANIDPELMEDLKEQEKNRADRLRSVQNVDMAKMIADRSQKK